jgi:hypothetical protein
MDEKEKEGGVGFELPVRYTCAQVPFCSDIRAAAAPPRHRGKRQRDGGPGKQKESDKRRYGTKEGIGTDERAAVGGTGKREGEKRGITRIPPGPPPPA